MRDISTKAAGDSVTPDEFNDIPTELENLITSAGITLSSGDLSQVSKALATYAAGSDFYTDSGSANSYVLSPVGSKQAPPVYTNGLKMRFIPANTNTGASTVNLNAIGAVDIVLNGNALTGGELPAGQIVTLTYDSASGDAYIDHVTNSLFIGGDKVRRSGYAITYARYESQAITFTSEDISPRGFFVHPNGTKLYVVGQSNDSIFQYTVSTPWDLSTATYDSVSISVASEDNGPIDVEFSTDGTKMYVVGNTNDTIYQYNLTTAWDLSTASYSSNSHLVAEDTSIRGISFKTDGTKLFVCGGFNNNVYQYTLTTAWDISTVGYDSVSFDISTEDTSPSDIFFHPSGDRFYMIGIGNSSVYQYSLATSWDLSTASYDGINFNVAAQDDTAAETMLFGDSGTIMYIQSSINDTIFQYSAGVLQV